jgi:hypothetical protein
LIRDFVGRCVLLITVGLIKGRLLLPVLELLVNAAFILGSGAGTGQRSILQQLVQVAYSA